MPLTIETSPSVEFGAYALRSELTFVLRTPCTAHEAARRPRNGAADGSRKSRSGIRTCLPSPQGNLGARMHPAGALDGKSRILGDFLRFFFLDTMQTLRALATTCTSCARPVPQTRAVDGGGSDEHGIPFSEKWTLACKKGNFIPAHRPLRWNRSPSRGNNRISGFLRGDSRCAPPLSSS